MLRSPRQAHDEGQTLLIALAFLVFVALVVTGFLQYAYANVRTTNTVRTNRGTNYDADGAMEIAIASMRINTQQGFANTCQYRTDASISLSNGATTFADSSALPGDAGKAIRDSAGRIQAGTTVTSVSTAIPPVVTMSKPATGAAAGDSVTFSVVPQYAANNASSPLNIGCFADTTPLFFQRHVYLQVCSGSPPCDSTALMKADVTFYDDHAYGRAVFIKSWSTR